MLREPVRCAFNEHELFGLLRPRVDLLRAVWVEALVRGSMHEEERASRDVRHVARAVRMPGEGGHRDDRLAQWRGGDGHRPTEGVAHEGDALDPDLAEEEQGCPRVLP